ncbi:hypothetical protein [Enterovirga sp. CN4-39]|uniref:hypothetical protein n=1 Tax=Enterovirga sp. CN4-39 TaxID=3400910 RepID=UPI003C124A27
MRQVTVDALEDMDLLKPDGGKVGDIEAVAESNADKKQVVVVERGGFLGFFAKQVAVPLENVAFRNNKLTLRDLDAARLESMPEFKNENGAYRDLDDAQQVSISVQ